MEYTMPGFQRAPFLLTLTILPLNFKIGAFSKIINVNIFFSAIFLNFGNKPLMCWQRMTEFLPEIKK